MRSEKTCSHTTTKYCTNKNLKVVMVVTPTLPAPIVFSSSVKQVKKPLALNLGASLGSTLFHIMKSPHVVACSCTKGKLQHLCVICFERRFGKKTCKIITAMIL